MICPLERSNRSHVKNQKRKTNEYAACFIYCIYYAEQNSAIWWINGVQLEPNRDFSEKPQVLVFSAHFIFVLNVWLLSPGNPRHNLFLGRYMMFVIIISSFIYSSGFIVHIRLNICCGMNTQLFLFSNYVAVLMCLYSSSCYKDTTLSLTTV